MNNKMKNCVILLFVFSVPFCLANTKIQYFAEMPDDAFKDKEDMWHPLLKKKWIQDTEYEIVDQKTQAFPSFLQKSNPTIEFLKPMNAKKLECKCKFIPELDSKIQDIPKPKDNSRNEGEPVKTISQPLTQQKVSQSNTNLQPKKMKKQDKEIALTMKEKDELKQQESVSQAQNTFAVPQIQNSNQVTPHKAQEQARSQNLSRGSPSQQTSQHGTIPTMHPQINPHDLIQYLYFNNLLMQNMQELLVNHFQNMNIPNPIQLQNGNMLYSPTLSSSAIPISPFQRKNYQNDLPQGFGGPGFFFAPS